MCTVVVSGLKVVGSSMLSDSVGEFSHRGSMLKSGQVWVSVNHRLESAATVEVFSGVVRKIDDILGLVCRW